MSDVETQQYSTPGPSSGETDDAQYKVNVGSYAVKVNKAYITSPTGIIVAVSCVLSLIAVICVAASYQKNCDIAYGSSYNFFEFVSTSWFIITFVRYFLFITNLNEFLCFKFIPWTIVELLACCLYVFFYFVGSTVVAAHPCWRDGYKAAATFGYLCFLAVIADVVFLIRRLRAEHPPTTNPVLVFLGVQRESHVNAAPNYDPETNMTADDDPNKY